MYLKAKIFVLAFEGQEFFSFISRENQTPLNVVHIMCLSKFILVNIILLVAKWTLLGPMTSIYTFILLLVKSQFLFLIFPIIISPIPFQERVVTVSIFIVRPSVGTNNYIFVIFEV